jgi:TRAP transporter TAXI family solute receptor
MNARTVQNGKSAAWLSAVVLLTLTGTGWAQKFARSVTIGANPPGTGFYAVAAGLSKVLSGVVPFEMVVQPYSGSSTFLPLLNSGELDFGIVNAVDLAMAYRGPALKVGGRNPFPHTPRVQLVMRGSPILIGFFVQKNSSIKTIHDVKGKRVTGEYPAHLAVWYNMFGGLASAGISWDEVKVVPVPAVNDGIDALIQARADFSTHNVVAAKVKEAHATVGLRLVSIDCSPEGEERLRRAVPGYYPRIIRKGSFGMATEDTCMIAYDIYWATNSQLPAAVVAAALKAVWDNAEKLPPIHPQLVEWARERAVGHDMTIPYHPGAVEFYKERKVWSGAADAPQKRLLAVNP